MPVPLPVPVPDLLLPSSRYSVNRLLVYYGSMRFSMIAFYCLFLCAALHADPLCAEKEFTINLKDPVFSQGVLTTDQECDDDEGQ